MTGARLTPRQRLVLRLLSLCPQGTSTAYVAYVLSGDYPVQNKGEVSSWTGTFGVLRNRGLVVRRDDMTHWNWSLTSRGMDVVSRMLVRARKKTLCRRTRR